ncbi:MAG: phosphocholine cytidylyltransferase family protein [Allosphingosinicella sp.]
MKCLILAAGLGSRLRALSASKPLVRVAGVPLIAHVVGAAAAGGATHFTVVTGHSAAPLEAFLAGLGARLGVTIEPVRTEDWTRPNGFSVLTGAAGIAGAYLLLMSDHLFDPAIARALISGGETAAPTPGLTLAVDRDLARASLDLDDATRVKLGADGRIAAIGKTLSDFDAVDTGLFRATPALADAIRADIEAGGAGSLSAGVQRLADAGRAATLDVTGRFWLDVDDPAALAHAEAAMAEGATL